MDLSKKFEKVGNVFSHEYKYDHHVYHYDLAKLTACKG